MTVATRVLISNKSSKYKLLFVHGFMGGPSSFSPLLPCLAKAIPEPIAATAVTLPGHDGVPPLDASFENHIENLAGVIAEEADGDAELVVYGYSMGGRLALQALVDHKLAGDTVAGLILESSSWGLAEKNERQKRLVGDSTLLAGVIDEASFRRFLRAWYRLPLFKGLREWPGYDQLIASKLQQNPNWLQQAISRLSVGHQPDLGEALIQLPIPKLYITGAWDDAYRQRIAGLGRSASPEPFDLAIIEGASHNCHGMAPEPTATAIANFIASLARSAKS